MVGIVSYGAYIPKYRLSRDLIAQVWGSRSIGGEKAVCNFDEDSITMAVEAALDCSGDIDLAQVDALYSASTTFPYKEKQSSSLIATAIDLRRDILTSDFSSSLRSSASTLKAALNAIQSGEARQVMVTAADCRMGPAESEFEQILGDGAASFLLGTSNTVANITGSYSISDEFTDCWRSAHDTFVQSWEERFTNIGYTDITREVATGIMNKYNLKPGNFSKLVLSAPNPRQHQALAKMLGFDVKNQLANPLFDTVGNTGTAQAPMMLVAVLEEAKPGDKILLIIYGDGSQAFIIEVTDNIAKIKERKGIKLHLRSKAMLDSYGRYMRFRNLTTRQSTRRPPTGNSLPILWREKKSLLSFYGSKCKVCSLIQHPVQRVCYRCGSVDEYEEVKLIKHGKIFSYTEDYIAPLPELPRGLAVVHLDDGTRVYVDLVEAKPQKPADSPEKIGMPVEMTFRNMGESEGYYDYYWKARPERR